MRVKKVFANNFRTLVDFNVELDGAYCTISGQNNAGKSAIIRIIRHFFDKTHDMKFNRFFESGISFKEDKTQFVKDAKEITIGIDIVLNRNYDSELIFFIEKLAEKKYSDKDELNVHIESKIDELDDRKISCTIENFDLDVPSSKEFFSKLRNSDTLVMHNSVQPESHYSYISDTIREVLDIHLSPSDRDAIGAAEDALQKKVEKAARKNKDDLTEMFGRLKEKYSVILSTVPRSGLSSSFPVSISLCNANVEIPLSDWGAGTQNRTRILISILRAARIGAETENDSKLKPIVLVEEPESFLHPSAQAEFGRLLSELANEFAIQIIATTHSPYMLNQSKPSSNILLKRRVSRGIPSETVIEATSDKNWMKPFAENLGIIPDAFDPWRDIFGSSRDSVILVEGEIDQEYFKHIKATYPDLYTISEDIEIASYGGRDNLKNTALLKFIRSRFTFFFITFDLDAEAALVPVLRQLGMEEGKDFCAIGKTNKGDDCIEGLLPISIKKSVYAANPDLATQGLSGDTKIRNSVKQQLKRKMLEEFSKEKQSDAALSDFKNLFRKIQKAAPKSSGKR